MNTQITAATAPQFDQFDLSNPQHLAMRKLMADVYARHANALLCGVEKSAVAYRGVGEGLERAAIYVLADPVLGSLSASLNFAMFYMEELYRARATA
ncbi:hypothetical protein [Shewanella xiamenensis]|uniref:hypothetical protein n=1 Tax=Shewanella xiamenensis TaxID=332186 RepID=UPI002E7B29D2|nr:hypothetical protein [Shewanella xiamenensis]MEE1981377.1 hypothetical protein [Shewanella xiamenensis]